MRRDGIAGPIALGLCALLLACGSATDQGPVRPPGSAAQVPAGASPITLLPLPDSAGSVRIYTGVAEPAHFVLGDAAQWAALWGRVAANLYPHPPAPAVDFERHMVVAAAMGMKPTGGYTVTIDAASRLRDTIYVVVREVSPGDRCAVPQVMTAPFAAALLPRSADPVLFVEHAEVHQCS